MQRNRGDAALFWSVLVSIVVLDYVTKAIAVAELVPARVPRGFLGDWFRWTLVYNPGAAFGLSLGPYSRWIFMVLTAGALVVLYRLYATARAGDWQRVLAAAMVCAGAIGNLIDRVRSGRGVVDFIDIGIGNMRWPTFNVADIAVSCGAILLAWVLWWEDDNEAAAARIAAPAVPTEGSR